MIPLKEFAQEQFKNDTVELRYTKCADAFGKSLSTIYNMVRKEDYWVVTDGGVHTLVQVKGQYAQSPVNHE